MTIDEAKTAKAALSETLAQAMRQFTADTGLVVEGLDLRHFPIYGASVPDYRVDVEVRL